MGNQSKEIVSGTYSTKIDEISNLDFLKKDISNFEINIKPTLDSLKNINDEDTQKKVLDILNLFSESKSETEINDYLKQLDTIIIRMEAGQQIASTASSVEVSQLQADLKSEKTKIPSLDGNGYIGESLVAATTGVVSDVTDAWQKGKEAYEDVRENGVVNHLKGESKTKENGGEGKEENEKKADEKLKKVMSDIDFNGTYSVEDLKGKVNNLKEKLKNGKLSNDLTKEEWEIVIDNLESITEDLEVSKEHSLRIFEEAFDSLENSIIEENGKAYLEYQDENGNLQRREFNSKEEAINVIRKAKSYAEVEMQNLFRTMIESLGGKIGSLILKGVDLELYILKNVWNNGLEGGKELFQGEYLNSLVDFTQAFVILSIFVGVNTMVFSGAFESMKRRFYNDMIMSRNTTNNPDYVYKDYLSLNNRVVLNPGDPEYDNWNRVMQREKTIEALKMELSMLTPGDPKYKKLSKRIKKLNKFILNKSDTFEILEKTYISNTVVGGAFKNILYRNSSVVIPFPWAVKQTDKDGKPILNEKGKQIRRPWIITRNEKAMQWHREALEEQYKKNMTELEKGIKTLFPENTLKLDNEKGIILEGSNERGEIYYAIIDYINKKEWHPTLDKEGKETNEKIKGDIIKKINRYFDGVKDGNFKSYGKIQTDLYSILEKEYVYFREGANDIDTVISEIEKEKAKEKSKMKKMFGFVDDLKIFKLYVGKIAILKDLKHKIEVGEWIGTKEELGSLLEKIKDGEVKGLVPGNSESKLYNDTDLGKAANLTSDLEKRGKEFKKYRDTVFKYAGNKLYDDVNKFIEKFKKDDFGKGLFNYIHFIADNVNEAKFDSDIEKLLTKFYEGNINFETKEQFYKEISDKIGYTFTDLATFEDEIKTYKKLDLEKFKVERLDKEYKINIDKTILYHFMNYASDPTNDISKYNNYVSSNLDRFKIHLSGQNYTTGQVMYILEKILKENKQITFDEDFLKEIDNEFKTNGFDVVGPKHKIEYLNLFGDDDIEGKFKSIDKTKYDSLLNKLKELGFEEDKLPSKLKNELFAIDRHKAEIKKIADELPESKNPQTIKNKFDRYIKQNNLENNLEFRQIINDFNDDFNTINTSSNSGNLNSNETGKQNIDIAEKSKQINELFERLQLQLILDGTYDSKKQEFLKLQNKYLNQNNIKNADLVLLESNLKNQFNLLSIKTKKDLKLEIKTKEIIDSSGNKVDFNIDFKFKDVFDKFRLKELRVKI